MTGVLIGFAIIGSVVAVGYLVGRLGILGSHAGSVMNRLAFFVASPCLLFTVLAQADVHLLFSRLLGVSAFAAVAAAVVFAAVARLLWRRGTADVVVGSLGASYVNANNIGIPVAFYVLGDAAYSAPVLLLQLLVFAPVALTLLDLSTAGRASIGRVLVQPLRNPILVASAVGVVVAVTGIRLPQPVLEPFTLIGGAAIPLVLLGFGMSLHGRRVLEAGEYRKDVVLAAVLKLVLMPLAAWGLAMLLGLSGAELYAAVVLGALPSAQNVYNFAKRYERGQVIARDTVLLTSIGALPVLLLVSLLLAP
ncbi:MAG TPA: AEC family transporter [Naasia sp.]